MEMNPFFVAYAPIGAVIFLFILYLVIKAAINNSRVGRNSKIQTRLLIEIALKQGVDLAKVKKSVYAEDDTLILVHD